MRPRDPGPVQSSDPARPPERRHAVVKLRYPIRVGSETVEVVYVKIPRAGELGLVPAPSPGVRLFAADYHPFAARLAGLSLAEFDLLEGEDYSRVMEAVQAFQSEVPPTGPSVSSGSGARSDSDERTS